MSYIRKSTHSIEDVYRHYDYALACNLEKVLFHGDRIKMDSDRLHTFFSKDPGRGLTCVSCGLTGAFFAKECSHKRDVSYHLNLYALDANGKEVLMTKDHIIPKSKGGSDELENFQTMCTRCNNAKGSSLEGEVSLKYKKVSRKVLHVMERDLIDLRARSSGSELQWIDRWLDKIRLYMEECPRG